MTAVTYKILTSFRCRKPYNFRTIQHIEKPRSTATPGHLGLQFLFCFNVLRLLDSPHTRKKILDTHIHTNIHTMGIILPVYEFSFAKGATRLLRGASRLAELSLKNIF